MWPCAKWGTRPKSERRPAPSLQAPNFSACCACADASIGSPAGADQNKTEQATEMVACSTETLTFRACCVPQARSRPRRRPQPELRSESHGDLCEKSWRVHSLRRSLLGAIDSNCHRCIPSLAQQPFDQRPAGYYAVLWRGMWRCHVDEEKFDAIVVGAGPAGTAAALTLARQGLSAGAPGDRAAHRDALRTICRLGGL